MKLLTHIWCTFLLILPCGSLWAQAALPSVVSGKLERIENFPSKRISSRNIDVWLPIGYNSSRRYAVLYVQDGQMLFDEAQTWNKQAWDIDDVASNLQNIGSVRDFIVVGIWNSGASRHEDYFPAKPYHDLPAIAKDTILAQLISVGRTEEHFTPKSDEYLSFIVHELKPYIDKKYAVYTDAANTFLMGSSMGGLISLYAICEYPEVFGGAASLSTHWPGTFTMVNNPFPEAFFRYLQEKLPKLTQHKFYFDCGDQGLDALYPEFQNRIDNLMKKNGFDRQNWITMYYPGEDHAEKAWKKRLNYPLEFILNKN